MLRSAAVTSIETSQCHRKPIATGDTVMAAQCLMMMGHC